jgi:DNA-binding transcriptional MocR family regulator
MNLNIQTTQTHIPPGVIDLGLGNPPVTLLPLDLLQQGAQACFARNDPACLQYGAEAGDGYFRLALAKFLTQAYGFPVEMDSLFVTAGASSGLDLLCTLYTRPGDVIFVEEPSYFLALRIFRDHGLRLVSIQTDEAGLVIEDLRQKLTKHRPALLYTIPTHQNPSGRTLALKRRDALARLSREHDFLVAADEVYHLLSYGDSPPRPLFDYAQIGNIVSVNSFSKILAPGLRLGWIQAAPAVIQRLSQCGLLDSGGGMNPFMSAIVRGLLEDGGLNENVARLRDIYGRRIPAVETTLRRHLPQAEYERPQGGYFFWVRLPGVDTQALQEKARDFKVDIRPGVRFSSQGGLNDYFRLCFAYYDVDEIEQGVMRLARCLHDM